MIRYGITAQKLYLFICSTKKSIFFIATATTTKLQKKKLLSWDCISTVLNTSVWLTILFVMGKAYCWIFSKISRREWFSCLWANLRFLKSCRTSQHQVSVSAQTFACSIKLSTPSFSQRPYICLLYHSTPSFNQYPDICLLYQSTPTFSKQPYICLLSQKQSSPSFSQWPCICLLSHTDSQNTICLIIKEQLNAPQCWEDVTDSTHMYSTYVVE